MLLSLRYLILIGWFLTALSLTGLLLFAIPAVIQLRKTLKALEAAIQAVHTELQPAIKNASFSFSETGELAHHFNQKMRIATKLLDVLNPVQAAADQTKSYLQRLLRSPRAESAALVAGLKKAMELAKAKFGSQECHDSSQERG